MAACYLPVIFGAGRPLPCCGRLVTLTLKENNTVITPMLVISICDLFLMSIHGTQVRQLHIMSKFITLHLLLGGGCREFTNSGLFHRRLTLLEGNIKSSLAVNLFAFTTYSHLCLCFILLFTEDSLNGQDTPLAAEVAQFLLCVPISAAVQGVRRGVLYKCVEGKSGLFMK